MDHSSQHIRASASDWESLWAPYDEPTYQQVLRFIHPDDVVVEFGAGDGRLAARLAQVCGFVYAIEQQVAILDKAPPIQNICYILADARCYPLPRGLTVGVLMMRHCQHYEIYASKLRQAGVARLITNARWRMGVEEVLLNQTLIHYQSFELGWYACQCGHTGFKSGRVEKLTPQSESVVYEVGDCPVCGIF